MIRPLNLPKAKLKLTRKGKDVLVWCINRKKELVLTPEEWVRQHVLHFLIHERLVPEGLIGAECALTYNGLNKRADLVVFDRSGAPYLIVECKAPDIPITKETLFQVAQYNKSLNSKYLMLTNGLQHVYFTLGEEGSLDFYEILPELEL